MFPVNQVVAGDDKVVAVPFQSYFARFAQCKDCHKGGHQLRAAAALGEKLPDPQKSGEVGLTGNIEDAQNTKWGGRIHKAVTTITKAVDKGGSGLAESVATQTPIRNFVSMSGGLFSEDMADGFIQILNDDKPLEGVGKIVKGVPHMVLHLGDLLKQI